MSMPVPLKRVIVYVAVAALGAGIALGATHYPTQEIPEDGMAKVVLMIDDVRLHDAVDGIEAS